MPDDPVLGIDFGTRTSRAAVRRDGGTRLISGWIGEETVESTVSHTDGETIHVGGSPTGVAASFPDRTVGSAKCYLRDVAEDPLEFLRPQAFAATVLRQLKQRAEADLGESVPGAAIAVPCRFGARQRQAVRDAAGIAGFDQCRLVDETTAAAMSHYRGEREDRTVLVVDLGAETLSTAVLDLGGEVYEVRAAGGDLELGGNRWDDAIVEWLAAEVRRERGVDLREIVAAHRSRDAAETAKRALSDDTETTVAVEPPGTDADAGRIERTLTRDHFEWLTDDLADRVLDSVERTLDDAGYDPHDVDEVLLVGGATAMPQIRRAVSRFVGVGPRKATASDGAVVRGAAIAGGIRSGHVADVVTLPVLPRSLGVEVDGGGFETLVARNTTLPTEESKLFTTASDGQTAVDVGVRQGDGGVGAETDRLDHVRLRDITAAASERPRIEVTVRVDADGDVTVDAGDLSSGDRETVSIADGVGLSEDEIAARREKLPDRMERVE